VVVQVAPRAKVEHEEELPVVLERVVHAGDERVVRCIHQHAPLNADPVNLLLPRDAALQNGLHCIDLRFWFFIIHITDIGVNMINGFIHLFKTEASSH
jgi:hypothetical protein